MKGPSLAWILIVCWPYLALLMTNNYLQVTCHESQVPAMSLRFSKSLTWTCSWLMIWVPEPVGHILTGQMQVQDRLTHGLTWTYVQLYRKQSEPGYTTLQSWDIPSSDQCSVRPLEAPAGTHEHSWVLETGDTSELFRIYYHLLV